MSISDLSKAPDGEHSAVIRERVMAARERQTERYKDSPGVHCNAQMTRPLLEKYAVLDDDCRLLLTRAIKRLNLSARAYDRILKVARTIADLDGTENIQPTHLKEAINYRNLDRGDWGE